MEHLDWLHSGINMTNALFDTIKHDLLYKISKKEISAINGISSYYISKVAGMIKIPRPRHLPPVICLDETAGDVKTYNKETGMFDKTVMVTNFSDGDTGEVLDLMPFITLKKLDRYFKNNFSRHERNQVKFVCCDMGKQYMNLASHCFPNATVCLDNFHIIQRLDLAMDQARIKYVAKLEKEGKHKQALELKKLSRRFKTRADHQALYWGDRYDEISNKLLYYFNSFPELQDTYAMLQYFHEIESDYYDYESKCKALDQWIRKFERSTSDIIYDAVKTIKNHVPYIHNAWENNLSNATCEGNNNLIKVIKRFSFGIHRFDYLRTRALLICGREGLSRSDKSPKVTSSSESFFYVLDTFPSLEDYQLVYDWAGLSGRPIERKPESFDSLDILKLYKEAFAYE